MLLGLVFQQHSVCVMCPCVYVCVFMCLSVIISLCSWVIFAYVDAVYWFYGCSFFHA